LGLLMIGWVAWQLHGRQGTSSASNV